MGSIPTTRSAQVSTCKLLAGIFASALSFVAAAPSVAQGNCQDIAADVMAAIQKDPAKLLMVVEDALVINEACAGEIVRAAIIASEADATLANQIGQTAVSVAPKMSAAIADAVSVASPSASPQLVSAGLEDSKNPSKNPIILEPSRDFDRVAPVVRGVYLIQPPPVGIPPGLPRKCTNIPTSPCTAVTY